MAPVHHIDIQIQSNDSNFASRFRLVLSEFRGLSSMLLHKSGPAAIYAILLGAAAVGVGPRAAEALAQSGADKPPRPSPHPDDLSRRSPGQMFVAVRVLDPDGKPVPRGSWSTPRSSRRLTSDDRVVVRLCHQSPPPDWRLLCPAEQIAQELCRTGVSYSENQVYVPECQYIKYKHNPPWAHRRRGEP